MSGRRRAGASLIELIVSCFVLSLLMLATVTIFLPCLQRFQVTDAEYDAQRSVILAQEKLTTDLSETDQGWIVASANEIAFPTMRAEATGMPVINSQGPAWQGWLVYWLTADPNNPGTDLLLRGILYPGGAIAPLTSVPAPPVSYEVMAAGVQVPGSSYTLLQALSVDQICGEWQVNVETLRTPQGGQVSYGGVRTVATH